MNDLRQPVGVNDRPSKVQTKRNYNTPSLSPSLSRVHDLLEKQPATVEQIKQQAYVADPRQMVWLLRLKGYPITTTYVELSADYRHKFALYSLEVMKNG